jgi:hypothetical protein
MSLKRIPMRGSEVCLFTRERYYIHWQRGEKRKLKRSYNKRFRKLGKRDE